MIVRTYVGEGEAVDQDPSRARMVRLLPDLRSRTAGVRRLVDASSTIQFGGCDGKVPNCIPIVNGWNYTVRLYRPRAEILSGKWKFPEAQPAG